MADSIIKLNEQVDNTERKFGEALEYYPTEVVLKDGTETWAMFTQSEIDGAIQRAAKNKEDIPKSLWESLWS